MEALAERDIEAEQASINRLNRRENYEQEMLMQRDNFALIYKAPRGLPIFLAKHNEMLAARNQGKRGDSAIYPVDKRIMVICDENFTSYDKAGPDGPKRLWSGVFEKPISDVTMVEAPPLPQNNGKYNYNQLSSECNLANYDLCSLYPDMDPELKDIGWTKYDAYADDNVFVSVDSLVENLVQHGIFRKSGVNGPFSINYDKIEEIGKGCDKGDWILHKQDGSSYFPKDKTWDTAKDMLKHLDFLTIRPLEGLHMQNIILAINGRETGISAMTYPNFQTGDDVANQTTMVNYTANYGIHISNRGRIQICHNAFYNGMLAGFNTKLVTPSGLQELMRNGYKLRNAATPCTFVIAIPKGTFTVPRYLEIRGRNNMMTDDNDESYVGSKGWSRYYGWDKVHHYYLNPHSNFGYMNVATAAFRNRMTYMGRNGHVVEIKGNTHHGYEFPGCAKVRQEGLFVYSQVPGVKL
jgi:hypothetical protein